MKRTILLLYMLLMCLPGWPQDNPTVDGLKSNPPVNQPVVRPNVAAEKSIVVYPNPSNGIIQITLSGFKGQRSELRIMNVIGNVVHREILNDLDDRNTKIVDLSKFSSGLYYVKLQTDNFSQIRKVIIN
ncbi:MAG: hypothetical protein COW65_03115 [Cytophagales bacterium CG18_big_fil_WC_8_21_14_2_50_42_9]|nr:MAG: hypothetical protein COW65_03115 [Cytophagales bacterium CG18_big_fil_WC_8_21_14_2_50_42_9]